MLNSDALVCQLGQVQLQIEPFFIRPILDSKSFSGEVMDWGNFSWWRDRIASLTPEDNATVTLETDVMICKKKEIWREYRTWIVDKKVVTASVYKTGRRKHYDSLVDQSIIDFSERMANIWSPDRVYVLDVADTPEGLKIIEINNLNSAGFYAADMNKLVIALESMKVD